MGYEMALNTNVLLFIIACMSVSVATLSCIILFNRGWAKDLGRALEDLKTAVADIGDLGGER